MANQVKGEVEFEAGGKRYTLSFSANAMCELEDEFDKPADEVFAMMAGGSDLRLSVLRRIFWRGLQDHHPETTLDETKVILRGVKAVDMGKLLGEAFARSMPQASEVDAPSDPPAPVNPAAGIGPAS